MFNKRNYIDIKIGNLESNLSNPDIPEHKRRSMEIKLYKLKSKYRPNVFHDSSKLGTYKKKKEVEK